ncbi:hypothetical protein TUM4637_25400 [Shewanella hafniensis]|nr:hypothetical protein TUM4637_25400 [Shewanella hafniensis]
MLVYILKNLNGMVTERRFNLLNLSDNAKGHLISFPVEFVQALATSLQQVLDNVS